MIIHCLYDALVPIGELKPHKLNHNHHPEGQIAALAKILQYQGFRYPVKVSKRSGFITSGHGRLLAAKKIGMEAVPVNFQDYDSEEMEIADLTADNIIASRAEFDLAGFQQDAMLFGQDFDKSLFGFEDIDSILPRPSGLTDPDDIPEHVEPRAKLGEIYELGRHRLMCGDSTSIDAVEKLMGGQKADMVFTDPPYGVSYEGGHNKKKRKGIENDTLVGESLTDLFYGALSCAEMVSHEHAAFYIWYANGKAVETYASFGKLNLEVRAVLCWYKIKSGLGAFMAQYIPNYEPCIYAFKKGCSPQWFGPSDEKTVWELQRIGSNEYHPTQKPVELPERALNNSSKPGDAVLDLFGGSGSTLIACEKTNRRGFMMELDPKYADVIIARWEAYSGGKAVLL